MVQGINEWYVHLVKLFHWYMEFIDICILHRFHQADGCIQMFFCARQTPAMLLNGIRLMSVLSPITLKCAVLNVCQVWFQFFVDGARQRIRRGSCEGFFADLFFKLIIFAESHKLDFGKEVAAIRVCSCLELDIVDIKQRHSALNHGVHSL